MAVRYVQGLRKLSPTIALYFATIALVGFAIDGGVYAVLLNLFLLRMGYGTEAIGLINAAGTLTFALSSLPAGLLGERWGSRRMLLIGLGLLFAGSVLLPFADTLAPAWQLGWLVVSTIVLYLGLAIYFVNSAPFVMGVVDAAQRNRVFSLQTALLSLASFVGSLVGGFLPSIIALGLGVSAAQPAPYRYALILAALALLPAMLAIRAAPHTTVRHEEVPVAASIAPPQAASAIFGLLAMIALVRLLQVAGLAATTTFFNVYLDTALLMPTAQIGAIIAFGRLLGVPAALATAGLTARFGNRGVVIGASLGTAISMLPLALIPHWGAAGLSFIGVIGLSWIRYAASVVYFLELVPPRRRATVSGVTEMAAGICFTAMTFGGGYMIALLGYRSLFLASATITGLSALVFWLCFRSNVGAKKS